MMMQSMKKQGWPVLLTTGLALVLVFCLYVQHRSVPEENPISFLSFRVFSDETSGASEEILCWNIVVLDKFPVAKAPMMLVVNASDVDAEKRIMDVVAKYTDHSTVKSRNMTGNTLDLIVELRTAAGSDLLKDIMKEDGITSASLLSHDGEVTF